MNRVLQTVVLVGAGATFAEAGAKRLPRKQRPPLDATFFELCRLAGISGRATITSYMTSNYGVDPFESHLGMEDVFNMIYADTFSYGKPPGECLRAYWALLEMYREAISTTTDSLTGASRYGIGGLLRVLWQRPGYHNLTFITFNQDLVIEKALEAASRTKAYADIPWDLGTAYLLPFEETVYRTRNSQPFALDGRPGTAILKLHGSLNWAYPVRSGSDPMNAIRAPRQGLRCLNDARVGGGALMLSGSKRYKTRVHMVPFIVPPIYEKGHKHFENLRPLWSGARRAIENADELFVFGYSFPSADVLASCMVRGAFHRNSSLDEVHVIDTNAGMMARLKRLLGAGRVHYYESVPKVRAALLS